jgi:hypothetical protein
VCFLPRSRPSPFLLKPCPGIQAVARRCTDDTLLWQLTPSTGQTPHHTHLFPFAVCTTVHSAAAGISTPSQNHQTELPQHYRGAVNFPLRRCCYCYCFSSHLTLFPSQVSVQVILPLKAQRLSSHRALCTASQQHRQRHQHHQHWPSNQSLSWLTGPDTRRLSSNRWHLLRSTKSHPLKLDTRVPNTKADIADLAGPATGRPVLVTTGQQNPPRLVVCEYRVPAIDLQPSNELPAGCSPRDDISRYQGSIHHQEER